LRGAEDEAQAIPPEAAPTPDETRGHEQGGRQPQPLEDREGDPVDVSIPVVDREDRARSVRCRSLARLEEAVQRHHAVSP